jgi:hypothetical protein
MPIPLACYLEHSSFYSADSSNNVVILILTAEVKIVLDLRHFFQ